MNTGSYQSLIQNIDTLIDLHTRNECVWSNFFVIARERLQKDPIFGAEFFITAYGGMFNYEDTGTLPKPEDESIRLQAAQKAYDLARELTQ